jgi:ribosomal protein S18 acetylase RimI-like enzyme
VTPAYHGRGLGQALLTACLAGLAAAGAPSVHLTVEAGNAQASGLYARTGFQPHGAECIFIWRPRSAG